MRQSLQFLDQWNDMPIVERMCQQYGPVDSSGVDRVYLILFLRLMLCNIFIAGFENNQDVKGYGMDYMRDYFGMIRLAKTKQRRYKT